MTNKLLKKCSTSLAQIKNTMRYHYALVRISKSTHTWRYVSFLLTLDFLCEDIMYGASYNSEEKVKKKKNNGDPDYWGEKNKTKSLSNSENPFHKCSRKRKHFCCWISLKPDCNLHHSQMAKTDRNFIFLYNQVDTVNYVYVLKINNLSSGKSTIDPWAEGIWTHASANMRVFISSKHWRSTR